MHIDKVQINSEFVTKFVRVYLDENIFLKHHMNIVSTKVCKSIGILSRNRCILRKFLWKQYFFYFINCYLNYPNIAWASTNKSKLQAFYHHQKHAARIINLKNKFTSAKPLLEQINALTVYEMNIYCRHSALCIFVKIETPLIFKHIYTVKPINKYKTRSKNVSFKPLCKKHFAKFKLSYRGPHL